MGPATNPSFGPFIPRSPVVGADEAHRPAIGREKAEKPSIAIDNERTVLSWPRRLKILTASRHQSRRFRHHTAMSAITPDKRIRGGQHETDVNDPFRSAPGKLAKNRRWKSPTGRFSHPPRPRAMHEARREGSREAFTRRPQAKY